MFFIALLCFITKEKFEDFKRTEACGIFAIVIILSILLCIITGIKSFDAGKGYLLEKDKLEKNEFYETLTASKIKNSDQWLVFLKNSENGKEKVYKLTEKPPDMFQYTAIKNNPFLAFEVASATDTVIAEE